MALRLHLKKQNKPANTRAPAFEPTIDEVVRSYRGGMSLDAIAKKFKVNPKTIQMLLRNAYKK